WVSAPQSAEAEVRVYDTLFNQRDPEEVKEGEDWKSNLNPQSLEVLRGCRVEPCLKGAAPGSLWQFERLGYFCADSRDSRPGRPVFNRTVTLRDPWARIQKTGRTNE
ncbi:MAG TPA: glutamine--tRNA ligase, partial [Acidobacteriota bacterium]